MTYLLTSITSGHDEMSGIWVTIGFSSKDGDLDFLHIVGGDPVSPHHAENGHLPIYLERFDQSLSCYQGADAISVTDGSVRVTLNKKGQDALGLPKTLNFVSHKIGGDFGRAIKIFTKMMQYDSGKIIHVT